MVATNAHALEEADENRRVNMPMDLSD
jgi:hypothetical protein